MKYSKVATLISLFIILFASCGEQKDNHDITIADYEVNIDDLDNKGIASISTYFSSVVPIVLETTDESLIKKINSIQVTNNLIFILENIVIFQIFLLIRRTRLYFFLIISHLKFTNTN